MTYHNQKQEPEVMVGRCVINEDPFKRCLIAIPQFFYLLLVPNLASWISQGSFPQKMVVSHCRWVYKYQGASHKPNRPSLNQRCFSKARMVFQHRFTKKYTYSTTMGMDGYWYNCGYNSNYKLCSNCSHKGPISHMPSTRRSRLQYQNDCFALGDVVIKDQGQVWIHWTPSLTIIHRHLKWGVHYIYVIIPWLSHDYHVIMTITEILARQTWQQIVSG